MIRTSRTGPRSNNGQSVKYFVLFAMLLGCWSLASPIYSGPDESAHSYRALSLVQGDLLASRAGKNSPADASTVVFIPASLHGEAHHLGCFAHVVNAPASCMTWDMPPFDDTQMLAHTGAARYNPLYYLTVGVPSLYVHGLASYWLMRLVSVFLCATFLALAASATAGLRRLAFVAGLTPTALFLGGTINVSAMETTAAAAVWALSLKSATTADAKTSGRALRLSAVPAAFLINGRPVSILWLAVIWTACFAVARRGWLREVVWAPQQRMALLSMGVATLLSLGWTFYSRVSDIAAPSTGRPSPVSVLEALKISLERSGQWLREALGSFGWNGAYLAWPLCIVWIVAVAGIVWTARPTRRTITIGLVVLLLAWTLSVLGNALAYNTLGNWWQGRYVLPLLVGTPLLLVSGTATGKQRSQQRISAITVFMLISVQAAGMLLWMHRTMNGFGNPFRWNSPWSPPIDGRLIVVTLLIVLTALAHVHRPSVLHREAVIDAP